jgi:hypothetical protein
VENYVQKHSEATFTHGLCPGCIKKYYPELEKADLGDSPQGDFMNNKVKTLLVVEDEADLLGV